MQADDHQTKNEEAIITRQAMIINSNPKVSKRSLRTKHALKKKRAIKFTSAKPSIPKRLGRFNFQQIWRNNDTQRKITWKVKKIASPNSPAET